MNAGRDAAAAALEAWADANPQVGLSRHADERWSAVLRGEHKRTIPVVLSLGAHTLDLQSFFIRAPDEHEAELYGYLLRRNLRTYLLRFALSPDGDVLIVAVVPNAAVTTELVDHLLGQLLSAADEAFDHALRLGFSSYIEREQAWRERHGMARNPIS